jgi:hypothetical protein
LKRQTKALRRRLRADRLSFGDLASIAHACIKMRDAMFERAEEARTKGDPAKAQEFERLGAQYNRVLVRIDHPAAIR